MFLETVLEHPVSLEEVDRASALGLLVETYGLSMGGLSRAGTEFVDISSLVNVCVQIAVLGQSILIYPNVLLSLYYQIAMTSNVLFAVSG